MTSIYIAIARFIKDDEGVTAIEYALIASLIAVVIIVGAGTVGNAVENKFCIISNKIGLDCGT